MMNKQTIIIIDGKVDKTELPDNAVIKTMEELIGETCLVCGGFLSTGMNQRFCKQDRGLCGYVYVYRKGKVTVVGGFTRTAYKKYTMEESHPELKNRDYSFQAFFAGGKQVSKENYDFSIAHSG